MSRRAGFAMRGMTLIEVVVFIVIVSVGLAGVLSAFNIATAKSADPVVRKQRITIAEQMLEEILQKDYANPAGGFSPATVGNPAQAERPSFDDVDDYNMTGAFSWTGIRDLANTPVAGLENYTVTVTVAASALSGIAAANAKKITVAVTGGGETVTLSGYRTQYE